MLFVTQVGSVFCSTATTSSVVSHAPTEFVGGSGSKGGARLCCVRVVRRPRCLVRFCGPGAVAEQNGKRRLFVCCCACCRLVSTPFACSVAFHVRRLSVPVCVCLYKPASSQLVHRASSPIAIDCQAPVICRWQRVSLTVLRAYAQLFSCFLLMHPAHAWRLMSCEPPPHTHRSLQLLLAEDE